MDAERPDQELQPEFPEEPPPIFASWNTWYAVVLLNLVFLIVLFSIFTRAFR
jgi:hypothetical protein